MSCDLPCFSKWGTDALLPVHRSTNDQDEAASAHSYTQIGLLKSLKYVFEPQYGIAAALTCLHPVTSTHSVLRRVVAARK